MANLSLKIDEVCWPCYTIKPKIICGYKYVIASTWWHKTHSSLSLCTYTYVQMYINICLSGGCIMNENKKNVFCGVLGGHTKKNLTQSSMIFCSNKIRCGILWDGTKIHIYLNHFTLKLHIISWTKSIALNLHITDTNSPNMHMYMVSKSVECVSVWFWLYSISIPCELKLLIFLNEF